MTFKGCFQPKSFYDWLAASVTKFTLYACPPWVPPASPSLPNAMGNELKQTDHAAGMVFEEGAVDKLVVGFSGWVSQCKASSVDLFLPSRSNGCAWPGSFAGMLIWCLTQGDFTGEPAPIVNPETAHCDILMMHFAYKVLIELLSNHIQLRPVIRCCGLQTFCPLMLLFQIDFFLLVKQQL